MNRCLIVRHVFNIVLLLLLLQYSLHRMLLPIAVTVTVNCHIILSESMSEDSMCFSGTHAHAQTQQNTTSFTAGGTKRTKEEKTSSTKRTNEQTNKEPNEVEEEYQNIFEDEKTNKFVAYGVHCFVILMRRP